MTINHEGHEGHEEILVQVFFVFFVFFVVKNLESHLHADPEDPRAEVLPNLVERRR